MLKEIRSGSSASNPSGYTLYKDRVYFSADNGVNGAELWSSDGTPDGTTLFMDLYSGTIASSPGNFIVFNGALYFTATDAAHGTELWVSDGSPTGTHIVNDIYLNSSSSNPANLTPFGNSLYFTATDSSTGAELWKTDGTSPGTVRLKDIRAGFNGSSPAALSPAGRYLYFTANDGINGLEVWRTDGTPGGTSLFFDALPGSASSASSGLLAAVDDRIFWMAKDAGGGLQLWRAGGRTDSPPTLVKQLYIAGSPAGTYGALTAVRGRLFWVGYDGSTPSDLWSSDGTLEGTVPADTGPVAILTRRLLPASNGGVYFGGASSAFGEEPYVALDTFAPTVADTWFDTATGRTIRIRFSEEVNASTTAQVRLTNRTTGEEFPSDTFALEYDAVSRTLSVTLSAPVDGEYRLTLLPSDLADLSGNPLVSASSFDFFILAGDANHDRAVDFNDLVKLAQNYNTTGKTFAEGDFNFDGNVDFNDLVILAQRYNTSLPVPGPVAATTTTAPVKKNSVVPSLPPLVPKKPVVAKKPVRCALSRFSRNE